MSEPRRVVPESSIDIILKYGFPEEIVKILGDRGFTEFNEIQQLAIAKGLFHRKNLIISAPTSSGKTLCAELAAVQHALTAKGAFYLVSLKALAEEKFALFRRFWATGDEPIMRTGITTGDRDFDDENLSQCKVTFATYEKFYSILKENPSILEHVSLVVIDELQTLGDPSRGVILETLLTALRVHAPSVQLLGLSAALANPEEIATWLDADTCRVAGRDIPLVEEAWTKSTIQSKRFGVGQEEPDERPNPIKVVDTLDIVNHLLANNIAPIVVFCMTKARTEDLARMHCEHTRKARSLIARGIEELKQLLLFVTDGGPTGRTLVEVVDGGIAFHHSDLSMDERQALENKIRAGDISVTYSTTTLGQGVNLPIAAVVFDDVYRHWIDSYVTQREYINMAGRAGRRGLQDSGGTSILICRSARDREEVKRYFSENVEPIESLLEETSLPFIALNLVASKIATNAAEIQTFIRKSFFGSIAQDKNPKLLNARIDAIPGVLNKLEADGFIFQFKPSYYRATEKGRITAQKNIEPETASQIIGRCVAVDAFLSNQNLTDEIAWLGPTIHAFLECQGESGLLYFDRSAAPFISGKSKEVCRIRQFEHPADPDRALMTAWVLSEWVKGSPYNRILSPFRRLREGEIKGAAEHLAWMLDAAASFSHLGDLHLAPRIPKILYTLRKRLLFGVQEPGVALMEVIRNHGSIGVPLSGIGRSKVQELILDGMDDLTKILEAPDSRLLKIVRDQQQVVNLKRAIIKYLELTSLSLFHEHVRRSEKVASKALVEEVYQRMGREFEVAVYELLRSISLKVGLLDEKKIQGCADLSIETPSGNIQIECKTAVNKQVSNTDAFEVLGKTQIGGKPIAFVTIAKPSFADMAIKNSFNNGVALLTGKTLVESVLQVLEGRRTADDFLSLLTCGHSVEAFEIR